MVYFFKLAWNHSPRSTWVIHMKIGNVGKHSNRIGCTLLQGLFLLVYYCTNHTYLAPKAELSEHEVTGSESKGGFSVNFESKRYQRKNKKRNGKRIAPKSKEWILNKKDRQRRQGKSVRRDTKFSGRKRKDKF